VLGPISPSYLAALYQKAVALVLPSLYEGFGLTSLEAMQQGCPVIASFCASLPEVCGKAALYIDPMSETSIASAIKVLFYSEEKRKKMIVEGFKQAEKFSWDKAAKILSQLFLREIFQ
jgi:glycosyltransferase involved in cell wall biosynthesis